ncbi:MAG: histidine phosphatase family protein [Proteobacteria bacterium]|nr:histidine phosphatase family protein [Pseudomonadota bacterium]
MTPCRLLIVRHGETSANLDGVWHGSTDTALTERGLAQAQRVAAYLGDHARDVGALYSSPLERARHTAAAIGRSLGIEAAIHRQLGEYDLGRWEGKTFRELHDEHRLWEHMRRDPDFAPHGGESPRGVALRMLGALRDIARAHAGERAIVVSHGGALSLAFGTLLEGAEGRWTGVMDNCAVSELVLEPQPELVRFNETGHLEGV